MFQNIQWYESWIYLSFQNLIVKEHIAQSFQNLQMLQNTFSRFYQLYQVKVEWDKHMYTAILS